MVAYVFLAFWGPQSWEQARFTDMVAGTAFRPFVLRRLLPDLVAFLYGAMPIPIRDWLNAAYMPQGFLPYFSSLGSVPGGGGAFILYAVLTWGCYLGHALAMRRLVAHFYPEASRLVINGAPLLSLGLLPLTFRYYNYMYDPGTALLFPVGLLFLVRGQLLYYYMAYCAMCLNKETAILLAVQFGLVYWNRLPRLTLVAHLAAQAAIAVGIFFSISHRFAANQGHHQFLLLSHNLGMWVNSLPTALYFLGIIVLFAYLVRRGWNRSPRLLHTMLFGTLLPLAFAGFLYGYMDELRDYLEPYPVLILLILPAVLEILGQPLKPAGDAPPAEA